MPIRVRVPGHGIVEFLDGTDEATMTKALASFGSAPQPQTGASGGGILQTAKDVGVGALKGAAHTALDAGGLVQSIPGVGAATNAVGNFLGGQAGKVLYGTEANPVSNDAAQADARQRTAYANTPQRVGGALETAAELAAPMVKGASAIPRLGRAGRVLQDVMSVAKDVPLNVEAPGQAALRIQQLADRGGTMPRMVRQFLQRTTDPTQAPLAYGEGQDFASNISRLSADEYNRLTPVIQREVGNLRATLRSSLQDAAGTVGKGDAYASGIKEYAQAAKLQSYKDALIEALKRGALPAASAGGLGYLIGSKFHGLFGE